MDVQKTDEDSITLKIPYKIGEDIRIFFAADVHGDSIHFDDKAFKRDMERAVSYNAPIIIVGDVWDAMLSKHDPRRDLEESKEGDNTKPYLNRVKEEVKELLRPYARNILVISRGNHEISVSNNNGYDMLPDVVDDLNKEEDATIQIGGWEGWIRLTFHRDNSAYVTKNVKYRHNGGSFGKITKGTLSIDRMFAEYPDADIIVTGDIHEKWYYTSEVQRVMQSGKVIWHDRYFLQCASYKPEWRDKRKTKFWTTTNKGGRGVGGHFMRFTPYNDKSSYRILMRYDGE